MGDEQDYVNLCAEAARLGIGIINDGVFSHTGADSIYFNRYGSYPTLGAYQSTQSQFYPWYDFRHFPDDYRCWWNFRDLPEVNEQNAAWQDYIIRSEDSIVRRWLRLGASGWRIDVADELPDEVLSLIRDAAKAEKSDSVIIGEVWEDAVTKNSYGRMRNYALGYSLDSVMNYPFRSAVIDFALGKKTAFELRDFLLGQYHNYPQPMYRCLMNLLGSHDVERLHTALAFDYDVKTLDRSQQAALTLTDEQKLHATRLQRLCAAIQYCVPGVPCLYYGDEECLDGGRDPFNRKPFEPSKTGLHNFYVQLGRIRSLSPALTDGEMRIVTPSADIIIILRQTADEKIACVINRSSDCYNIPFNGTPLLGSCDAKLVPPMSVEIYKLTSQKARSFDRAFCIRGLKKRERIKTSDDEVKRCFGSFDLEPSCCGDFGLFLRHCQGQHAIVVGGGDSLGVDALDIEAAGVGTIVTLTANVAVGVFFLFLTLVLGGDGQAILVDINADVFLLKSGKIGFKDILAVLFGDVGAESRDIVIIPKAAAHFFKITERVISGYTMVTKRHKFKHNQYLLNYWRKL